MTRELSAIAQHCSTGFTSNAVCCQSKQQYIINPGNHLVSIISRSCIGDLVLIDTENIALADQKPISRLSTHSVAFGLREHSAAFGPRKRQGNRGNSHERVLSVWYLEHLSAQLAVGVLFPARCIYAAYLDARLRKPF